MSSLNLSEYFNNHDDSDGRGLAEFLRKKRGGVQRVHKLFMNCEAKRQSLHVRLEKLPGSQQQTNDKPTDQVSVEQENGVKKTPTTQQQEKNADISVEEQIASLHGEFEMAPNMSPSSPPPNMSPSLPPFPATTEVISPTSPARQLSPIRPISPARQLSPIRPISPIKPPGCSRPSSPRLSAVRKSGGCISPGDRLRRISLKRLTSKIHGGRRTLLEEFESTVDDNFEPPVCSTPLSQPIPAAATSPSRNATSQPMDTENFEPNVNNKESPAVSDSCCGHTDSLIKTLQIRDVELKNYMERCIETTLKKQEESSLAKQQSLQSKTKSPLKRTYTLEKGQSPGQVVLTPDKCIANPNEEQSFQTRLRPRVNKSPLPSKIMKTPERLTNRSMISIRVKSPHNLYTSPQRRLSTSLRTREMSPNYSKSRGAMMIERSRSCTPQNQNEVLNTPPKNVSIIFPTQDATMDIEIPETQDLPPADKENCIMIQSNNTQVPVVVIPINQTYNRDHSTDQANTKNKIIAAKPKQPSPTPIANTNAGDEYQNLDADNLKLTDILTEDEEDDDCTHKTLSRGNEENVNSPAPLNLAASATSMRTKRLRKRSLSRRRLQMERSQLLSTGNESEPPSAHTNNNSALNRKRIVKRKHLTLNRAPGTPLNGEKFAIELQRMSNYEILDLRKRNSLGRVFALTDGRKSSRLLEEANKKQLQLDDEIEMELLRRNLENSTNISIPQTKTTKDLQNDNLIIEENLEDNEYPPVPDAFRDDTHQTTSQENNNDQVQLESSLVDEKSSDRISFKPIKRTSSRIRRQTKSMPDVLQQYLEVSKFLKRKKKSRQNQMDQTKRFLYTQGNSDSEELNANSSTENVELTATNNKSKKKISTTQMDTSKNTQSTYQLEITRTIQATPRMEKTKTKRSSSKSSTSRMEVTNRPSIPYVPSPPPSETDNMPSLRVVSPPPPLTISLRSSHTEVEEAETNTNEEEQLPPPPPEFESNADVSSNNNKERDNITQHQTETAKNTKIVLTDDDLFKKPLPPPPAPKKINKRGRNKTISDNILLNDMHQSSNDISPIDSSLRRSKRKVNPLPKPIFQILYEQNLQRRLDKDEKRQAKIKQKIKMSKKAISEDISQAAAINSTKASKAKNKIISTELVVEPEIIESLQNDMQILNKKKDVKTLKKSKGIRKHHKNGKNDDMNKRTNEQLLEFSKINLTMPPPVDHFNNVFNHLRDTTPAASATDNQNASYKSKVKKVRVRVKRVSASQQHSLQNENLSSSSNTQNNQLVDVNSRTTLNSVSSSSSAAGTNQSNFELISWLKNITESESAEHNDAIFKEMRISSACNLSFSTIQGVEYAFYDTDEKASLGYLRFKPGQKKPKKKAKRFSLHFVTLFGQFRITANDKESVVGPGDMIAIEKSVYYDIENITNDIGLLMVVKK